MSQHHSYQQNVLSSVLCHTCILTGCGQQQRLRGWSRMVVKQFQDGGRPPFWKSIYCHISVKNHRVWSFVHSRIFWTAWTSRDQKWNSCIGQTPSSTECISSFIENAINARFLCVCFTYIHKICRHYFHLVPSYANWVEKENSTVQCSDKNAQCSMCVNTTSSCYQFSYPSFSL